MNGFTMSRRVAFSETDAAGLMHFSRYLVWMEDCEHALLRSLGATVHAVDDSSHLYPRVSVHAEYKRPLRFEEEVDVRIAVRVRSARSITYAFTFTRRGDDTPCATGQSVVVCSRETNGKLAAVPLPPALARALDALLETA